MTNNINFMRDTLPKSVTSFKSNLLALFLTMSIVVYLNKTNYLNFENATFFILFSYAFIVMIFEIFIFKIYLRKSSGLNFQNPKPRNLARIFTRIFGLIASVGFVGFLYWLFVEYSGSFYFKYWSLLKFIAPFATVISILYLSWIDKFQLSEDDTYYKVGNFFIKLITFQARKNDFNKTISNHFLGWIIKGFFFPLMYTYACDSVKSLLLMSFQDIGFVKFYDHCWTIIFGIDVIVVTVGYIFTMRILDSHIRSPQPTMLGWVSALVCYQPFWGLIGNQYLKYNDDLAWDQWLSSAPILQYIWGISILILISIYSLSSVAFGLRFSNLTNRGIITSGPYKYTKHPAYITKNLSWWLVSVPFISTSSTWIAIKSSLLLLMLNGIYYVRAKTEEKHLSEDPDYLKYMEYIKDHGVISKIKRKVFSFA